MPDKYVALTDPVYGYALAQRSDANDPVMAELYAETFKLGEVARMMLTPEQASLLGMLVAATNTKWALEIGCFTGISSISIARHLAPGGKLFCFDQDFKYTSIARRAWIKAGIQDRIDLRLGDARRLVPHFRPQTPLDFVFIDADKESYDLYYNLILPFVRTSGLIIFDNTLRGGQVADFVANKTPINRAIDTFNRKLATDSRVASLLLPIADGMTICRKLPPPSGDARRLVDTRRV
jgi:caffeoyl-CoA O-methyltransferase